MLKRFSKITQAKAVARKVVGQPPSRKVEVPKTKRPPKYKERFDA